MPTSLDHEDYEQFYGITLDTNPTPAECNTAIAAAYNVLAARLATTVDDSNADEATVVIMLASQQLEIGAYKKAGGSVGMSTESGSLTKGTLPVLWTDDIKDQVLAVYGIDLDAKQAAPSSWAHVSDGTVVNDR